MKKKVDFQEILQAHEHEVFRAEKEFKSKSLGNRTYFNLNSFNRDYKLKDAYASVLNLEISKEDTRKLGNFRDYVKIKDKILELKPIIQQKQRPSYPTEESYRNTKTNLHYPKGEMLVFVNKTIFNSVKNSIDQYVLDVGRDGYWATIYTVGGGKPEDLRSYIIDKNPKGVVFVGNLPAAWYEMDDDFHDTHSEFPCDLYFMDTNGNWNDPDNDGKFNEVTGAIKPDIWVGRIWSPTKNGNDANIINDYFTRNHEFRLGQLGHSNSSLAYVDDDWQGFDDCEMDELFPTSHITKYTNPDVTDADLYKAEVNSLRSWVQLCAHSSTQSHALHVPSEGTNEYINYSYFKDTNPPNAHFYNLFCCGPGRFTSNDYLAGWYIFDKNGGGKSNGLTAIASAKSGSMLMFADFYRPMGQGKDIGEAFVDWWKVHGSNHDLGERRWYYGLTILGDPTLTWWKGCVPELMEPQNNDVFDHYPRKTIFKWKPLEGIENVRYDIEIDAFHAINSGKWAEETGQTFFIQSNILDTKFERNFVGMQPGRWRVRAKVDSHTCSWSQWQYFEYKI